MCLNTAKTGEAMLNLGGVNRVNQRGPPVLTILHMLC